jgi:NADP-dependent 3-hydroxy acid dehydrogenase YdfG
MDGQDLCGQSGIVTGAGKGICAAVAIELARRGASVVACARTQSDLDNVVAAIHDAGGRATALVGDVTRYADMAELAETCVREYGTLDFAVANAGMVVIGTMADGDPEDWRRLLETNVLGTAHTIRAALPIMRDRHRGHIVIMSSMSGRVTYPGEPMYVTSKWALSGLGGCLRKEARAYNVRVTLIEPGLVDTPMIRASEEGRAELAQSVPITAEACAQAVAYALGQPHPVDVAQIALLSIGQEFTY